jgi:hypothetical protein
MFRTKFLTEDSAVMVTSMFIATILLLLMLPSRIVHVDAAQLPYLEDVLTQSKVSTASNHSIVFQSASAISGSTTIIIGIPAPFQSTSTTAVDGLFNSGTPLAANFDIATSSNNTDSGYSNLTIREKNGCTAGTQASSFEITSISTSTGPHLITLTHCANSDTVVAGNFLKIKIGTDSSFGGTGTSVITNAPIPGQYDFTVTASSSPATNFDIATSSIFLLSDNVSMTAAVNTNFSFNVTPVTWAQSINGEATLSLTSGVASTSIAWGTLSPGSPKVAGHRLNVGTNAQNGFMVTVRQTGNMTSGNGAAIYPFTNNDTMTYSLSGSSTIARIASSTAWASPSNVLATSTTWGHYGVTSDDSDLATTLGMRYSYVNTGYAPVGTTTDAARIVMHNAGPSNGSTNNIGSTTVGYKIEIGSLLPAASDYSNTLIYVATPAF